MAYLAIIQMLMPRRKPRSTIETSRTGSESLQKKSVADGIPAAGSAADAISAAESWRNPEQVEDRVAQRYQDGGAGGAARQPGPTGQPTRH